jgi:hypothetical protein
MRVYTERRCPLCRDMDDSETDIPKHIRRRCPVAAQIRVYEMGLPPAGYDATMAPSTAGAEAAERDEDTGQFVEAEA